ncbi:MAG: twin-arginine translocase TatA/TatE family subunit [Thermomicrobiales bacterium]
MLGGLGWQELVIVLVIIMIIFGAGKLPEIAKSLGQGVREFREESNAPIGAESAKSTVKTAGTAASNGVVETREAIVEEVETVRTPGTSRDAI